MAARLQRCEGPPPSDDSVEAELRGAGLEPRGWANDPGYRYGWHAHQYTKILYCLSGKIVFHLRDQDDLELHPGDRLEVEPGTEHAATVGPEGVRCVEAPEG